MNEEKQAKQREHSKRSYWKHHEKNLDRVKSYNAQKREENREAYNQRMREYNAANKERINARRRQRRLEDQAHAELLRERDRKRHAEHPDRRRNSNLKSAYGISLDDYDELYRKHDGKCMICGDSKPPRGKTGLVVDHCHSSGVVRGLLCTSCNQGIGLFKDSCEILHSAIRYLT